MGKRNNSGSSGLQAWPVEGWTGGTAVGDGVRWGGVWRAGFRWLLLGCAVGIGLGVGPGVRALEPRDVLIHRAGPVLIKPKLTVAGQYTDNLYSSRAGSALPRESDFIGMFRPGLTAELGRPESQQRIVFEYALQGLVYVENSQNNAIDHYLNLTVSLRGERLESRTSGSYSFLSSIVGGYERFEEGVLAPSGKVDRNRYSLSQLFEYDLTAKTSAYVRGSASGTLYDAPSIWYDRNEWRVAGGGTYAVTPKMRALVEAYYGQISLDANSPVQAPPPDLWLVGGYVGVRSGLTDRLSGSVRAGYEYGEYFDGVPGPDGFTARVDLSHRFTERLSATLGYSRGANMSVSQRGVGTAPRQAYVSNVVSAGVRHALGVRRPVILGATLRYGLNEYEEPRREREFFGAGVSATYPIREWVAAALAYDYEKRWGDVASDRYDVNRVTASVIIGY